ncbi:MAG: DUF3822 family protein [Barnesiella sp.]|nr:DUF3822 family protein [Bacteroidales bacterium]MBD5247523.1 DUF3822 family protein [Barnesiella sp.]
MTLTTPLTRELVNDPAYCRLDLRIGAGSLQVMIYNPLEENSLLLRSIDLPADEASALKQLETFIYDNPLLLCDFRTVTAIIESRRFLPVPAAVADCCDHLSLLRCADPDTDSRAVVMQDALDMFDARLLTPLHQATANFLRRTFPTIRLHNALLPFTLYCHSNLSQGNTAKAFVNMRERSLDIVVMSANTLLLLNRFEYRDINDAAYYILNCTDTPSDEIAEIIIGGNHDRRDELMPMLRRFRPYVMPMIFPSAMFKAGADAMKSPFDLIILPLCE